MLTTFDPNKPNMPQIKLKDIPTEIYQHIQKVQGELKIEKRTCQFSLEKTVIKIIRDHKELTSKKRQ